MKEKFELLSQSVVELLEAFRMVKDENGRLTDAVAELTRAKRELEERMAYQVKLIEALQSDNERAGDQMKAARAKVEKIDGLIAVIEQAQGKS